MRTKKEIQETISKIEEMLADERLKPLIGEPVKEGYLKAIEILKDKQIEITRAGLIELSTIQSRAISVLAIDYLKEECTECVLLGCLLKIEKLYENRRTENR